MFTRMRRRLLITALWGGVFASSLSPGFAHAQAPTEADSDQATIAHARELTLSASARFDSGDYEAALAGFLEAYELLEGDRRQANVLNNIAVCYQRLFRYDAALEYYERYLAESESDASDRAEVEAIVAGLKQLLGEVTVEGTPGAELWVDGDARYALPCRVVLPAGMHEFEVSAPDHVSQRRTMRVTPQSKQSAVFELEPIERFGGAKPAYFWSGVAITGVAFTITGAFGIRALREDRRLRDAFAIDQARVHSGQTERLRRLQLRTDIALGASIVAGIGTLVMGFLTDWQDAADDAKDRARLRPQFIVDRDRAGVALAGAIP